MTQPFVNEEGTKWWPAEDLAKYADSGDKVKLSDHNYRFWRVETKDGYRTFLVTVDNAVVYDSQDSGAVAVMIDVWRMLAEEKE